MFHSNWALRLPTMPGSTGFFCLKCWGVFRVYAVIGFGLILLLVAGLFFAVYRLNQHSPMP